MIELIYGRKFLLDMMPQNSVCLEIGVSEGRFTEEILTVVKPKKLHLVDPWESEPHIHYYEKVYAKFRGQIEAGQVEIHRGKSKDVSENFPDRYFDWIYIDGNHSYKGVHRDLQLYYPKVKRYGFITGDDYSLFEKRKGLRDAVAETSERHHMRLILIKNNQYILWKKDPGIPPEGPLPAPTED